MLPALILTAAPWRYFTKRLDLRPEPRYQASQLEPSNPVINNDLAPAADGRAPAVTQPPGGKDE